MLRTAALLVCCSVPAMAQPEASGAEGQAKPGADALPPAPPEPPIAPARPLAEWVVIEGNKVMPVEVYLAVLDLPADAQPDAASALEIERRLTDFLHRSGYVLGSVSAVHEGGQIKVGVNEGRLEKVVFRGRLTLQTLRFKLALALPHEVFNRPALDRAFRELGTALGLTAWYELVPTAEVLHTGPQLEALPTIRGYDLVHARQPFELHVFFTEREWDEGLGVDVRSGYTDGLEFGLNHQGRGGLLPDDRWRLAASGGIGLRRRVNDERYYAAFSRTFAEARWFSPRLPGNLRPFLWVQGDFVSRQRRDLNLEDYHAATADGSLHLEMEPRKGLRVSLGGGFEWRRLFGFEPAPGKELSPDVHALERTRSFALARAELVFDPDNERTDRRHALTADARQFFGIRDPWFGYAEHRYQRVMPLGWHDLWFRSRGKWLWGEVPFHSEMSAGEYLHGLFGVQWVRRAANANLEFRFSVTRDLFKVGLFHDLAVFGELDRATGQETLRMANSFGPGLHTLIEGMFQLDVWVAFGFRSGTDRLDTGVSALLLKVF